MSVNIVELGEGSSVPTFSCSTDSTSPTSLTWRRITGDRTISSGVTQMPLPGGQNIGLSWNRRVQVDDTALYVCQAVNRNGTSTSSLQLSIIVPPTITSVFPTPPYYILNSTTLIDIPLGYRGVVLTCLAFGSPALTSLSWIKVAASGQRQIISDTINRDNRLFVSVEIDFRNGFESYNAGDYTCSAYSNDRVSSQTTVFTLRMAESSLPVLPCSVSTETIYFDIRVLDTDCSEWSSTLKQHITFQFLRSIKGILSVNCEECSTDASNLLSEGLVVCSSIVEGAALFRGVISDSSLQHTENIFCALSNWHQVGSAIIINDNLHQVDSECNLMSSQEGPECARSTVDSALISTVAGSSSAFGLLVVVALVGFVVFAQIVHNR